MPVSPLMVGTGQDIDRNDGKRVIPMRVADRRCRGAPLLHSAATLRIPRWACSSGGQRGAEDANDSGQESRDLHLTDSDLGGDLGLAPVIDHPPAEDQLVPSV